MLVMNLMPAAFQTSWDRGDKTLRKEWNAPKTSDWNIHPRGAHLFTSKGGSEVHYFVKHAIV